MLLHLVAAKHACLHHGSADCVLHGCLCQVVTPPQRTNLRRAGRCDAGGSEEVWGLGLGEWGGRQLCEIAREEE